MMMPKAATTTTNIAGPGIQSSYLMTATFAHSQGSSSQVGIACVEQDALR
jgi:hypothetical protein